MGRTGTSISNCWSDCWPSSIQWRRCPFFLSLVVAYPAPQKRKIAGIAGLAVAATLLIFAFFGADILNLFAISLPSFRIAGGLLLLLLALDMMRSDDGHGAAPAPDGMRPLTAVAIIPLAIPIMAGPGAISTVIIYASANGSLRHKLLVGMVIITAAIIAVFVLRLSTRAERFLSQTTMQVFRHVMGLLIAAVAIEFMLSGLAAYFPKLVAL